MACADPAVAAAEQRFLDLLQQVQQFSWYDGQLTLSYGQGNAAGVMFLEAMPAEESPRP
jgi:heat shock protein HslJ